MAAGQRTTGRSRQEARLLYCRSHHLFPKVVNRHPRGPCKGAPLAQWKVLATTFSITERTAGKKLCDALRKLATNDGTPVVSQIMALERELASLDAEIAWRERAMNALVYGLYGLSAEEIEMVEKG
jgi:hypothetical protein